MKPPIFQWLPMPCHFSAPSEARATCLPAPRNLPDRLRQHPHSLRIKVLPLPLFTTVLINSQPTVLIAMWLPQRRDLPGNRGLLSEVILRSQLLGELREELRKAYLLVRHAQRRISLMKPLHKSSFATSGAPRIHFLVSGCCQQAAGLLSFLFIVQWAWASPVTLVNIGFDHDQAGLPPPLLGSVPPASLPSSQLVDIRFGSAVVTDAAPGMPRALQLLPAGAPGPQYTYSQPVVFEQGLIPTSATTFLFEMDFLVSGFQLRPGASRSVDELSVLFDNESVGVKLRGSSDPKDLGKFEIKALVTVSRPFALPSGISGRMDQWVKWSFDDPDKEQSTLSGKLLAAGKWIEINKTRWARKFSFDAKCGCEVRWKEDRPSCGCNMELTQIRVMASQSTWISIAFEAFGPPEATPGYLFATMNQCFGTAKLPSGRRLSGVGAMSYPSWLATLT